LATYQTKHSYDDTRQLNAKFGEWTPRRRGRRAAFGTRNPRSLNEQVFETRRTRGC
jgi:hypothetical protein